MCCSAAPPTASKRWCCTPTSQTTPALAHTPSATSYCMLHHQQRTKSFSKTVLMLSANRTLTQEVHMELTQEAHMELTQEAHMEMTQEVHMAMTQEIQKASGNISTMDKLMMRPGRHRCCMAGSQYYGLITWSYGRNPIYRSRIG